MATGKITGTNTTGVDVVNSLGPKKFDKKAYEAQEKEKAAIRLKVEKEFKKKGIADLEKIEEAYINRLNKFEANKNKETLKQRFEQRIEDLKTIAASEEKLWKRIGASAKATAASFTASLANTAKATLNNTVNVLSAGIDQYLGAYSQYMSKIEARIQGTGKSFSGITNMIDKNIGASQYVTQKAVLDNLSNLVEQGISYNVEQRAFLQTVSDKIATTFDAANGTLLQLIKIQQADSTAARLGLEAQLTKFLNANFSDTSYLNSLYDTVSANLLGVSSQSGRDRSVALEYVIQKWLGSLSSVGMSDSTVSTLAQGLNYLGTGDVSGLTGNTALQNLLVMSASRTGVDYSTVLTNGLNAETANKLLSGVVEFIQDIGTTNNQVIKSKYAELFGLEISDFTASLNLTSDAFDRIYKSMMTFDTATQETANQLKLISGRTAMSERIENLYQNIMSGVGENIANSAGMYTAWLVNDVVEKATGGINIPFVTAVGSGVDVNANVNQLVKLGLVGISTLSEIGTIMGGLSGKNNLSLNNWNAKETITGSKGAGFTGIMTTGTGVTTTQTAYIGNSSGSDMVDLSIASSKKDSIEEIKSQENDNELIDVIKDSIAVDVSNIYALLFS